MYDEDGNVGHGACSRNNEIIEPEDHSINIYWRIFDKYSILDRLNKIHDRYPSARTIVIQGEATGRGSMGIGSGGRVSNSTRSMFSLIILVLNHAGH
jgi:hypothetical protein